MTHNIEESLYHVLGVGQDASFEMIKESYKKLAHKYHPDKKCVQEKDTTDSLMFDRIQTAWEILRDENSRKKYDSQLKWLWIQQKQLQGKISEEVILSSMEFLEDQNMFVHPCRCSDFYRLSIDSLKNAEQKSIIVACSGCSLIVQVINDVTDDEDDDNDDNSNDNSNNDDISNDDDDNNNVGID